VNIIYSTTGPRLREKLISQADKESAELMTKICKEEVNHVKYGLKWFIYLCEKEGLNPKDTFQELVKRHLGFLPSKFNIEARNEAGLDRSWYEPLEISAIRKR
jgi:uncharacterized ferritin-like protein (DUF455 family)